MSLLLSEMTPDQIRAEREDLEEELEAADREAAPLLCQMMAEEAAEEMRKSGSSEAVLG